MMLDSELKQRILGYLNESEALLSQEAPPPAYDYQSLLSRVAEQELKDDIATLRAWLEQDDFEAQFKAHCRARARRNEDTALSFSAMPNSSCNELYFKITKALFKPKTIADLLAVLLPDSTHCITPSMSRDSQKQLHIKLELTNVANLDETLPDQADVANTLGRFIVLNKHLFDVMEMTAFNFELHEKLHQVLNKEYPDLLPRLYQHNTALRTLQHHLLRQTPEGQTPLQVILFFITELRAGGSSRTGNDYASPGAQRAFTDFLSYLESLPPATKAAILALKNDRNKSIGDVIQDLHREDCVETAAHHLQSIVEMSENKLILNQPVNAALAASLGEIKKQYGPKHPLSIFGETSLSHLPTEYLEKPLSQIVIEDEHNYLSLLLSFPPEYYTSLLQYARIQCIPRLPNQLASMIRSGILNATQQQAFYQAILQAGYKLGTLNQLYLFCVNLNNPDFFMELLSQYSEKDRLAALKEKDSTGKTILHLVAYNPKLLKTIVELYPEKDRLAAVQEKDDFGRTVLHMAAYKPESLKDILALYPQEDRLAAVQKKDSLGSTLLHQIADNPELLKTILELLPKKDRLAAVQEKDGLGRTVLHRVAYIPELLMIILESLPPKDRLAIVQKDNVSFHQSFDNPELLRRILAILPFKNCLSLLKKKHHPIQWDETKYGALTHSSPIPEALSQSISQLETLLETKKAQLQKSTFRFFKHDKIMSKQKEIDILKNLLGQTNLLDLKKQAIQLLYAISHNKKNVLVKTQTILKDILLYDPNTPPDLGQEIHLST